MAIFDRLDRMVSRTADRQFSVSATITPMRGSPNGRSSIDPERGEMIVKGIFSQSPADHHIEVGNRSRSGNDLRSLAHGNTYEFSVDTARYPDAALVRQNDHLLLDDARAFQVTSTQPDGLSRVVLILSSIT